MSNTKPNTREVKKRVQGGVSFSLGVTRMDRIRNEYIRETAHVGHFGDKVREAWLRWFGHVQRRQSEYIGQGMLSMELPGEKRKTSDEVHGCNEGGHADDWCGSAAC